MALVHLYLALTPLGRWQILPEKCLQLGRLQLVDLLVGLVVGSVLGQDLEYHRFGLTQLLWAWHHLLLLQRIQLDDLGSLQGMAASASGQSIIAAPQAVEGPTDIRRRAILDEVYTRLMAQLLLNGQTLLLQSSCIHLPLQHIDIQGIMRRQLLGCQRKEISLRCADEDHLL